MPSARARVSITGRILFFPRIIIGHDLAILQRFSPLVVLWLCRNLLPTVVGVIGEIGILTTNMTVLLISSYTTNVPKKSLLHARPMFKVAPLTPRLPASFYDQRTCGLDHVFFT